jgi:hypothetical protein
MHRGPQGPSGTLLRPPARRPPPGPRLSDKGVRLMRPSLFTTLKSKEGLFMELATRLMDGVAAGKIKQQIYRVSLPGRGPQPGAWAAPSAAPAGCRHRGWGPLASAAARPTGACRPPPPRPTRAPTLAPLPPQRCTPWRRPATHTARSRAVPRRARSCCGRVARRRRQQPLCLAACAAAGAPAAWGLPPPCPSCCSPALCPKVAPSPMLGKHHWKGRALSYSVRPVHGAQAPEVAVRHAVQGH